MKKLTKTLSLVLVVAMVLSLCVIGASATFTDKDKVTPDYNEAVGIMTDLAVVKGYPDGSFKPAGTLTRAEACVIMSNMTLGATAATALAPTTVTFKDVPTSYWGYKYVEYCYQCGYIAGTGNGNFTPGATLTGYQWALMLMRILGYDMTSLTTGNWQINTAKVYYADDTSFSSVTISGAAVTREAASQMAYDALFAGTSKTTGYAVYFKELKTGVYQTPVQQSTLYASMTEAATAASTMNAANGFTIYSDKNASAGDDTSYYYASTAPTTVAKNTLAKTVFGVTKTENGLDTFGRPATVYTASSLATGAKYGWTNATKTVANLTVKTYTAATKAATILTDLAGYYSTTGVKVDSTYAAALALKTGNGKVVSVYADSSNVLATPVEITYTVGTVTNVVTATNGTVTYTIKPVGSSTTFPAVDYPATSATPDTISLQGTVAKGDVVTYVTENSVTYVYPTTKVTGSQTAYNTANNSITVGGTTYTVGTGVLTGAAASAKVLLSDFSNSTNAAVYYLDQYGYAVATTATAASTNYAYIVNALGTVTPALTGNTPAFQVLAVLQDGTVGSYTVNMTKDVNGDYWSAGVMMMDHTVATTPATQTAANGFKGNIYGYVVSGTTITLEALTAANIATTDNVHVAGIYTTATATNNIVTGTTVIPTTAYKAGGTYSAIMNNSTVYVNYNGTKNTAVSYTGNTAIPATVTIPAGAKAVVSSDGATVTVKAVFSTAANDTATTVTSYLYINKDAYTASSDGTYTYYTYTGVAADGTTVTVKATSTALSDTGLYTYNSDNSISNTNAVYTVETGAWNVRNSATNVYAQGTAAIVGSLITVDGGATYYNVTDSTKTVYIDSTKTAVDGSSVVLVRAVTSTGTVTSTIATIYVIG